MVAVMGAGGCHGGLWLERKMKGGCVLRHAGWRRREKEEERVGVDENERVGALSMAGEGACGGWPGRECGNDGREVRRGCGCPHEGGGCSPSPRATARSSCF